jgi:hypothetical protein
VPAFQLSDPRTETAEECFTKVTGRERTIEKLLSPTQKFQPRSCDLDANAGAIPADINNFRQPSMLWSSQLITSGP